MSEQPVSQVRTPTTRGRTWGLGRDRMPTPREHCQRCKEIIARSDQMVTNYIMANMRQVQIINRMLGAQEPAEMLMKAGEELAEQDALLEAIHNQTSDPLVKDLIATYIKEKQEAADV